MLSSRRWDIQHKIGIKAALPGLDDPVLWLDTLLPLVSKLANLDCNIAEVVQQYRQFPSSAARAYIVAQWYQGC